jgi:hypothetical protein
MKMPTVRHINGYQWRTATEEEKNIFRVAKTKEFYLLGYNAEVHAIISQKAGLWEPHITKTGFIFHKTYIDNIGKGGGGVSISHGGTDKHNKEAKYSSNNDGCVDRTKETGCSCNIDGVTVCTSNDGSADRSKQAGYSGTDWNIDMTVLWPIAKVTKTSLTFHLQKYGPFQMGPKHTIVIFFKKNSNYC